MKNIKAQIVGNNVWMSIKDFIKLLKYSGAEIDKDLPGMKGVKYGIVRKKKVKK